MPPTQSQAQSSAPRRAGRPLHPSRAHSETIAQWYREGAGATDIVRRLKTQLGIEVERRHVNRIIADMNLEPHQQRTEETPELLALVEELVVRHKLNDAQCIAEVTRRGHRITPGGLVKLRIKNGWRRRRANIRKAECCGKIDCPTFAKIFEDGVGSGAAAVSAEGTGQDEQQQPARAAPEVTFVGHGGLQAQAKMDQGKVRRRRAYEVFYDIAK